VSYLVSTHEAKLAELDRDTFFDLTMGFFTFTSTKCVFVSVRIFRWI